MPTFSELMGRYATLARGGRVYSAYATLTAPVIYTTAAGTGGPLIWNPGTNVDVQILGVSAAVSVASTVAGSIGFSVGSSQTAAPSSTTAIDASGSTLSTTGAAGTLQPSVVNVYRKGTVSTPAANYTPLFQVDTGAITVSNLTPGWIDLGGLFIIAPNTWGAITASATLTTAQIGVTLIWAEVPRDVPN